LKAWIGMSRLPFASRNWHRHSMSGPCGFSQRRKPMRLVMAASRVCPELPVFAVPPSKRDSANFGNPTLFQIDVSGEAAGAARRPAKWTTPCYPIWKTWWSRWRAAIQCRLCAGPARAPARWRLRLWNADMQAASAWSTTFLSRGLEPTSPSWL
jgi:hypothetical protein